MLWTPLQYSEQYDFAELRKAEKSSRAILQSALRTTASFPNAGLFRISWGKVHNFSVNTRKRNIASGR